MYDEKLLEQIAERVRGRLAAEEAFPLTGQVISAKKVRDAFEQGHRAVRIPKGALVTAEASDYLYEKRMTVVSDEKQKG